MKTCVILPLQVGIFVSNTPAWEMERSRLSITEILCLNIILMVVFSFVASLMADWAKSKPLIGFGGLFSAALATMSGFGFCCYVGVEFISLVRIRCYSVLGTILLNHFLTIADEVSKVRWCGSRILWSYTEFWSWNLD